MKILQKSPLEVRILQILPLRRQGEMLGCQVFLKGERKDGLHHISATKRSRNLATQHLGVATSDIHSIFLVSKSACKFLPPINDLYLVEHEDRLMPIHLLVSLLDGIQVGKLEIFQSVVLKIEVKDFLWQMSLSYHLLGTLI